MSFNRLSSVVPPAARLRRLAALAAGVLLLYGCGTVPDVEPVADPQAAWREHLDSTARLNGWTLSGRVGIEGESESVSASLSWVQDESDFRIRLSGAFGQGLVEIASVRGRVELRDADGLRRTAPSAEVLLREMTGWRLPLAGLQYWVLGRPRPDVEVVRLELDAAGRLARLEQDGWDVRVERHVQAGDLWLPARLSLTAPRLRAKMVVHGWDLR